MKKLLCLLFGFIALGCFSQANAELLTKNDYAKLLNVGNKILKANNIDKRLTFNFTAIGHQGCCPAYADTSRVNDYNLHNNRIVNIYVADYFRIKTEDELAAILSHNIAQGVHSYTGVLNGQLFFTKNGLLYLAKRNELQFDKTAVDYMVNAGYNPYAIVTAYEKILPEWRGTFWLRHNKAEKRITTVKKYIEENYPGTYKL